MTPDFLRYVRDFLIPEEGSTFENDESDHGNIGDGTPGNYGTKFGIDAASHPRVNIPELTQADAEAIYWGDWLRYSADKLPFAIAICYFDEDENQGVDPGAVALQAALNHLDPLPLGDTIPVDGVVGPKTIAAAAKANVLTVTNWMLELRAERYLKTAHDIPRLAQDLDGWLNRVENLRRFILKASPAQQEVS